jgi:hypothetical protein
MAQVQVTVTPQVFYKVYTFGDSANPEQNFDVVVALEKSDALKGVTDTVQAMLDEALDSLVSKVALPTTFKGVQKVEVEVS